MVQQHRAAPESNVTDSESRRAADREQGKASLPASGPTPDKTPSSGQSTDKASASSQTTDKVSGSGQTTNKAAAASGQQSGKTAAPGQASDKGSSAGRSADVAKPPVPPKAAEPGKGPDAPAPAKTGPAESAKPTEPPRPAPPASKTPEAASKTVGSSAAATSTGPKAGTGSGNVSSSGSTVASEPTSARMGPPVPPVPPVPPAPSSVPGHSRSEAKGTGIGALLLAGLALLLVAGLAWWLSQRVGTVESQVKQGLQSLEQRDTALEGGQRQVASLAAELQTRIASLETQLGDTSGLRSQVQELGALRSQVEALGGLRAQVEKLLRERADDSFGVVLVEAESALNLASQQLAFGANPAAVLARLEDLDQRIQADGDARFAPLRTALRKDIEKLRAFPATDIGSLAMRLESLIGSVEKLPLREKVQERFQPSPAAVPPASTVPSPAASPTPATTAPAETAAAAPEPPAEKSALRRNYDAVTNAIGSEIRSLFRVRRLDDPNAMLIAPEQAYFLRENLRLSLLNARLALMSRNENVYKADLERVRKWVETYYEPANSDVAAVKEQLHTLAEAKLMLEPPRIDESLAALRATRASGR